MQHSPVSDLETPSLLIDRDILQRNLSGMQTALAGKDIALRPHAKTHKIPEIARLQVALGAVGITVATLGEAEVFAAAGIDDVFIAYPLWMTPRSADRVRAVLASTRLSLGVDSAESAENTAALLGPDAARVAVRIEVDSGHHRSGVRPEDAATVALAARSAGLAVEGVFTFPGHSYAPGAAAAVALDERDALTAGAVALEAAGIPVAVRSGGSTPTALLTAAGTVTEARPGVYAFGDAQQWELGRCAPEDIAVSVLSTVVSAHERDGATFLVADAGSKILGSDRPAWTTGYGRVLGAADARIVALSEHHATIRWPGRDPRPALGSRLRIVPNHVCLAMNLVDDAVVTAGDQVVDVWHVAARGRNG